MIEAILILAAGLGAPVDAPGAMPPRGLIAFCARAAEFCRERPSGRSSMRAVRRVNRDVNAQIAMASDATVYGVEEFWTLPTGGRGDCEDFALEKLRRLRAAGGGSNARLAVAFNTQGVPHAVLVVEIRGKLWVADNMHPALVRAEKIGYEWLKIQTSTMLLSWRSTER